MASKKHQADRAKARPKKESVTQKGAGSGQALKKGEEQAVTGKGCSKKPAASEHVRKKPASQLPPGAEPTPSQLMQQGTDRR